MRGRRWPPLEPILITGGDLRAALGCGAWIRQWRLGSDRGSVHANSVKGFNLRVQRTVAGVFHHISPEHADLYFHEIGFRWLQRIAAGEVLRRTRRGREITRTIWSRVPPALQMAEVAVSRQVFAEILSLIARLRAPPAPA